MSTRFTKCLRSVPFVWFACLLAPPAAGQAALPNGISAEAWNSVRAVYEAGRHAVVKSDGGFRAEAPRELFRFRHQGSNAARTYDVAPDGRFLMVESGAGPRSRAVTTPRIILNFLSELERLVPTR